MRKCTFDLSPTSIPLHPLKSDGEHFRGNLSLKTIVKKTIRHFQKKRAAVALAEAEEALEALGELADDEVRKEKEEAVRRCKERQERAKEISVLPHPVRLDHIFVRVTPTEGWAKDGEFFFWFLLNGQGKGSAKATTFPRDPPVIGCLTHNPIFSSVTSNNEKKAREREREGQPTKITMSVGATAICIPGMVSGHKADWKIASNTYDATKETYADKITDTGLDTLIVERTVKNSKRPKRTELLQNHGGDLSKIITILVSYFMAGPSAFESEHGAKWGMTHIKDESPEDQKERLEKSRKGSIDFNKLYLPELDDKVTVGSGSYVGTLTNLRVSRDMEEAEVTWGEGWTPEWRELEVLKHLGGRGRRREVAVVSPAKRVKVEGGVKKEE
ncbi:hypothetical protein TrCOL_g7524 [Triparma columacea]|uniref:Uncharacterized protein n=1 Tax=Triparma columacea TaxID=722753 RepID=A0A9W7G9Y8_9STRA|nr:hypothetical protein TrCOL_g7524 [Triparma columacea]